MTAQPSRGTIAPMKELDISNTLTEDSTEANPKVGFVSLGCPKALVDSERIITQLRQDGYQVASEYEEAGVVVVNTCGFIDSAKQESLDSIREAMDANGKVIVTGCLSTDADLITSNFPDVLSVSGAQQYESVVSAVHTHLPINYIHDPKIDLVPPQGIKLTPRHYAYLKISEGCNHRCSFCIIPSLRGDLVSRPIGDVLDEAKRLADAGVKELLVVSQDTSAYGLDLKFRTGFWNGRPVKTKFYDLCEAMAEMGIWVRLHYVYPYPHVDEVLPLMAEGKILPYLDIPFQHASPKILRAMKRPANDAKVLERIKKWREICPDLTIRSTFIVGFPGETEDDFQYLMDWMDEAQIDRAGAFQYEPVDGAKANALTDHVTPEISELRHQLLMDNQRRISEKRMAAKIGSIQEILIDQVDEEGIIGRSKADAPEIDGLVYIDTDKELQPGDMIKAKITAADEYDLWGSY
jgi:ribosomal protein S12 methylthiotransferase